MDKEKTRILVLDDDEAICMALRGLLEFEGYEVHASLRGKEAIDLCIKEPYQVVLSDIMMPEMDGITFLENIKDVCPYTEVIMITALSTLYKTIECMKKGAFGYVNKPFDNENLLFLVQKAAEHSKIRRDLVLQALKKR